MPINQRIIGHISLINDTAPLTVTYKLGHFQRLISYLTKEMLYNPTEQMGCWRREITETKLGLENPWNFPKIHRFSRNPTVWRILRFPAYSLLIPGIFQAQFMENLDILEKLQEFRMTNVFFVFLQNIWKVFVHE